ncbi:MAG: Nif3-like dinuclear metal center hexameric protein [Desulfosudaceae bacterium]
MAVTVKDIVGLMNQIAPPDLAEAWDNCGLQAGSLDWEVETVWTALDPSPEVVREACHAGVDLLVSHHPLYMSPPPSLDFERMPGKLLKMIADHRLSIFSAHTNFDSVAGGLNDICAQRLGLKQVRALSPAQGQNYCKLVIFLPETHEDAILKALEGTSAGTFGDYSGCSFATRGTGRFKPSEAASPYIGRAGELAVVEEIRLETIVETRDLAEVIRVVRAAHPYETMAYDVFPLAGGPDSPHGLGRLGELHQPMSLREFGEHARDRFGVKGVRIAGDPDLTVQTVALCSGSGSGLMSAFLAGPAEVYVSGDLKYHDGTAARDAGRGLVDVGHFETECLAAGVLSERIRRLAEKAGLMVTVEEYCRESNPYTWIF